MEQQAPPPYTLTTKQRESRSVRPSSPSLTSTSTTTLQSTATNTTNQSPLSASEPTLRFPRPQGSRHLANWISTSNPDIMRITTTTEDTELSDSTYELITGTDTESQDGNYTESISDSIASLDFHRPDDVHSLADTEHTYDDESLAESEVYPQPAQDPQEEDQQDTTILDPEPTISKQKHAGEHENEPKSVDEEKSRSSLEYTNQHLSTPSILTPEASGIVERPTSTSGADKHHDPDDAEPLHKQYQHYLAKAKRIFTDVLWFSGNTLQDVAPAIITAALLVLGVSYFMTTGTNQVIPNTPAAPPAVLSSVVSTTVVITSSVSTSRTSTTQQITTSSTRTAALVPLENVLSDDWLFPSKKMELFMSKHHGDYLIHIDPSIKYHCLAVAARRGDDPVQMDISHVEKGLLLKFPYEETHGTVRVEVASRCRPKIRQVLEIPFGERGIMEEAVEKARHLVQDVCDRIPSAAQEAERRFEETKHRLETASTNAMAASDHLFKDLITNFHEMHRSLGAVKADARERIREMKEQLSKQVGAAAHIAAQRLPDPRDIQDQAQLGLLDAQLSAKILWLKLTGNKAKHDDYKHKATAFLNTKVAEAKRARRARLGLADVEPESYLQADVWSRIFREARCRRNARQGRKETHQCVELA